MILLIFLSGLYAFRFIRYKIEKRIRSKSGKDHDQLNEGLSEYFVALDDNDHACFIGQEQFFSRTYNL